MTVDVLEHERIVQRRVRTYTLAATATTTVILVLSFISVTITDAEYRTHVARGMDWTHRLWLVGATLPSGWVMRSARRRAVVVWAVWFVAAFGVLELLTRGDPVNQIEWVEPPWVQPSIAFLSIMLAGVILIVLPLVRLPYREPPGLPIARVVT